MFSLKSGRSWRSKPYRRIGILTSPSLDVDLDSEFEEVSDDDEENPG